MSAGEDVIRKRCAAALDQGKHYVAYLRVEDVNDLLRELDSLRAQRMYVAPRPPDGVPTAVMLGGTGYPLPRNPAIDAGIADAVRAYEEPTDG